MVDEHAPDCSGQGMWSGPGVLGDYRPPSSDVDAVAVTAERLKAMLEVQAGWRGPSGAANDVTVQSGR